jgi:hypothetical protein
MHCPARGRGGFAARARTAAKSHGSPERTALARGLLPTLEQTGRSLLVQSLAHLLVAVWNGVLLCSRDRRSARPLAALLACLVSLSGCAHRLEHGAKPQRLRRFVDPYSRNSIVCVPTAIGNLAGVPGVPLWLATVPFNDVSISTAARTVFVTAPAFAGGALTGLPFLPLSYLEPEVPCHAPPLEAR